MTPKVDVQHYNSGLKRSEKVYYDDGKLQYEIYYQPNGKLSFEVHHKNKGWVEDSKDDRFNTKIFNQSIKHQKKYYSQVGNLREETIALDDGTVIWQKNYYKNMEIKTEECYYENNQKKIPKKIQCVRAIKIRRTMAHDR